MNKRKIEQPTHENINPPAKQQQENFDNKVLVPLQW
jgi:hypothetical protein